MLIKIYLVGNSLIDADAMPFKIKPLLQKCFPKTRFIEFDPTENFPEEKHLLFIDTVINLKDPQVFTSVDDFEPIASNTLSVHSFDFYAECALRKKLGLFSQFTLIGVPSKGSAKIIADQTADLLRVHMKR